MVFLWIIPETYPPLQVMRNCSKFENGPLFTIAKNLCLTMHFGVHFSCPHYSVGERSPQKTHLAASCKKEFSKFNPAAAALTLRPTAFSVQHVYSASLQLVKQRGSVFFQACRYLYFLLILLEYFA